MVAAEPATYIPQPDGSGALPRGDAGLIPRAVPVTVLKPGLAPSPTEPTRASQERAEEVRRYLIDFA